MIHPCVACPECDDVQNDACQSCEGTDQYCPICDCPARDCEFVNDIDDHGDFDDDFGDGDDYRSVSDSYEGPGDEDDDE